MGVIRSYLHVGCSIRSGYPIFSGRARKNGKGLVASRPDTFSLAVCDDFY